MSSEPSSGLHAEIFAFVYIFTASELKAPPEHYFRDSFLGGVCVCVGGGAGCFALFVSWCLMTVVWLFLAVPWACLQFRLWFFLIIPTIFHIQLFSKEQSISFVFQNLSGCQLTILLKFYGVLYTPIPF